MMIAETEYAAWKQAAHEGKDLDEAFPEDQVESPRMFEVLDGEEEVTDYYLLEFSDDSVLVLSDSGQTGEVDLDGRTFSSRQEADEYLREVVGGDYILREE